MSSCVRKETVDIDILVTVNIQLLLITALLLTRIINKQYLTMRWSSRISIICRSNSGVYY